MKPAERLIQRARAALAAGRLAEARAAGLEALRLDPHSAAACHALGDIAWAHGALEPAVQYFERAHAIEPADPIPLARLSGALVGLNRLTDARAAVDRCLAQKPRDAFTLETLGVTLTRTGDYHRATPLFERSATLSPRNTGILLNLGLARQYVGDLAGAETALRRVIALDPSQVRAYQALVETKRQTPRDNHAAALEALFAKAGGDVERTLVIGHALAKTCEDLDDFPRALDWLHRAKAARRAARPYAPEQDGALFDAAIDTPASASTEGADGSEPIFVVGMPRSGTTLVDRILSSHPEVGSVGELQTFPHLLKLAAGTGGVRLADAHALRAAAGADLTRIGRAYMDSARSVRPDRPRLVDKLPFNFLHAGLIHRALPNARIVCLRREAMDTCLSNYRQLFGQESSYHDYAYDLGDIAGYYIRFDRLIAHWRRTLPPDRFMELRYEDLVAAQEDETRRLLAFCGLPWNPRCLAFHENEAGVSTASVAQVRQPMFSSSIGRWRRYGPGVAAAEAVLAGAGLV